VAVMFVNQSGRS